MKENVCIQKNQDKWKKASDELNINSWQSPDVLADMYLDITSDLAYAQTHYPESQIIDSLNNLAFRMHNTIYKKKSGGFKRFVEIWTKDIPKIMYESRKMLWLSFIAFMVFTLFGMISQLHDQDYARTVMGEGYVDMTIHNINQGKPTDVYSSSPEVSSFLAITLNNLLVDLKTFAAGIFTSLGTILILFFNGIMLGCFQTFFFQYGVGWESVLAIWQHGALEIPACIISGAAGITLGHGWLFPKTYSRMEAFKISAKKGLKIMLAIIPITVIAGFIEGFITRHTELPTSLRITTIVIEFAFIIFYFIILPMKYKNK